MFLLSACVHESVREMPSCNTKKDGAHKVKHSLIYTYLHIKVDIGVFVSLDKKSASPKLFNVTVLSTRDGCKITF